MEDLLQTHA